MKKPMRLNVQIGRDSPKTDLEDSPLQISMKQKTRECKSELRECRDRHASMIHVAGVSKKINLTFYYTCSNYL